MKKFYPILFLFFVLNASNKTNAQIKLIWQKPARVADLKFSDDVSKLITVGTDINIWDANQGTLIKNIQPVSPNSFTAVAISKDGKSFVTGNGSYTCQDYCYSLNAFINKYYMDGTLDKHISTEETNADALDYSPDGKTIAAGYNNGYYDVDGIVTTYDTSLNGLKNFYGHIVYGTASVKFTPDNKYLVSGGWDDGNAQIWDYRVDTFVQKLPHGGYNSDGGNYMHVDVSPDSRYVVTGGLGYMGNKVKIWRIADGALVSTIDANPNSTGSETLIPAISPDGKYIIASLSGYTSPGYYKFMIWNFATGKLIKETALEQGYISAITFSKQINGKYLFAYGKGTSVDYSVNVLSIDPSHGVSIQDAFSNTAPVITAENISVDLLNNPFINSINLKVTGISTGKTLVTLTDLSGRVTASAEYDKVCNQILNFNVGNIHQGTYVLNVLINNTRFTYKVIKN